MNQRNETLKRLVTDLSGLVLERDIVHPQRPRVSYPDHVREVLNLGVSPPYFFWDKMLIFKGVFPGYDKLREAIEARTINNL